MTDETSPRPNRDEADPSEQSGSRWAVLVPAAALVIGLVIGGVVVGVAGGGSESPSGSAETSPSSSPEDETSPSAAATVVVVPDECLEAVSTVEEVTEVLRQGADAVGEFRTDELRSLLRDLEALDLQAREQVEACRDVRTEASP